MPMKEMRADLFQKGLFADILCITTNGTVCKNGSAVMGKGCALVAKTRWPGIEDVLGKLILEKGNKPHLLGGVEQGKPKEFHRPFRIGCQIWSFPVKQQWFQDANPDLIVASAKVLRETADKITSIRIIAIPRPGCGAGGLSWTRLKSLLMPLFDDRFVIFSI